MSWSTYIWRRPSKYSPRCNHWNLGAAFFVGSTKSWDIRASSWRRVSCRLKECRCPTSTGPKAMWGPFWKKMRRSWPAHGTHESPKSSICWSCRWSVTDRPDRESGCLMIAHSFLQRHPCSASLGYQWAFQSVSQIVFRRYRSWNSYHFRSAPKWSVIYTSPNCKYLQTPLSFSCL